MNDEIKIKLFCNKEEIFEIDSRIDDNNVKDPNSCIAGVFNSFFNKKIVIENNSTEVFQDFEITMNGKNYDSLDSIKKSIGIIDNYQTPNVLKVFNFFKDNIFHATSRLPENKFSLYLFNFWGYALCYDSSVVLGSLSKSMGIEWRQIYLNGHSVNEYLIDGNWSILDADQNIFYLNLDNKTLSSYEDIIKDPFLSLSVILFLIM